MALGVRVRFRSRDGSLQGERVLRQMPVRLGRNAMNDCALGHPFISDFHAVLDLVDDQLCVRDLNSRNGVYDRNMARLPAGRSIPLSALGHTFVVGRTVEVWVETFEESRDIGQRASSFHGAVLGNRAAMAGGWAGSGDAVGSALGNALPARAPGVGSQGIVPLPPLSIGERSWASAPGLRCARGRCARRRQRQFARAVSLAGRFRLRSSASRVARKSPIAPAPASGRRSPGGCRAQHAALVDERGDPRATRAPRARVVAGSGRAARNDGRRRTTGHQAARSGRSVLSLLRTASRRPSGPIADGAARRRLGERASDRTRGGPRDARGLAARLAQPRLRRPRRDRERFVRRGHAAGGDGRHGDARCRMSARRDFARYHRTRGQGGCGNGRGVRPVPRAVAGLPRALRPSRRRETARSTQSWAPISPPATESTSPAKAKPGLERIARDLDPDPRPRPRPRPPTSTPTLVLSRPPTSTR